ncbi:hypothetical protein AMJ86_00695 [bacterium SM23_57]|nr:MAG: hypothetical protein AMJ86_00695 [bacterium SM23_57]
MIQKVKNIKRLVAYLLEHAADTRDNDRLLILKVWAHQNPRLRETETSFLEFAIDFKTGKYADPESIRRTRQKLQELNPLFRGKKYRARMDEEVYMRREIKQIKL